MNENKYLITARSPACFMLRVVRSALIIKTMNDYTVKRLALILAVQADIEAMPWFFKTYDAALEEAVRYFKWDLMEGTQLLS